MKPILLHLTITLSILACSNTRKAAGSESASAEQGPPAERLQIGGTEPADSLFLSLERTPCFGRCKTYRVHVYRSGYMLYEGRSNVELVGKYSGRIGPEALATLHTWVEEAGFFNLQDKYDGQVTDLPSTYLHVVADGKDKTVLGRVGQPASFKNLVTQVEELLLPSAWKPLPATE